MVIDTNCNRVTELPTSAVTQFQIGMAMSTHTTHQQGIKFRRATPFCRQNVEITVLSPFPWTMEAREVLMGTVVRWWRDPTSRFYCTYTLLFFSIKHIPGGRDLINLICNSPTIALPSETVSALHLHSHDIVWYQFLEIWTHFPLCDFSVVTHMGSCTKRNTTMKLQIGRQAIIAGLWGMMSWKRRLRAWLDYERVLVLNLNAFRNGIYAETVECRVVFAVWTLSVDRTPRIFKII